MMRMSLVVSSLWLVLGLLLAACAPAATPTPRAAPPPGPTPAAVGAQAMTPAPVPTPLPAAPVPTPTVAPAPPAPAVTRPAPEKPRSGGILLLNQRADFPHYDIAQAKSIVMTPIYPAYSLLVQNDPLDESKLVPDLAERWEISPEGKVYTFYLRPGVKFHDGKPLTAADVKASFELFGWPPKGYIGAMKALLAGVVSKVEAPDDLTVRFTLKYPVASFLARVALPLYPVYPKDILSGKGDMKKAIVGSGPFKFKEYIRGVSFELERNPDYFLAGRPYLDGIMRYVIRDEASILAAFRTRRLHMLGFNQHDVTPQQLEALKGERPEIDMQRRTISVRDYAFNFTRKAFAEPRVRRAIALATDPLAMIQVVRHGAGEVGGIFPPGSGWGLSAPEVARYPGFRRPQEEDIAQARRLLAEAGYAERLKMHLVVRTDIYDYVSIAVVLKEQLRKIGIDVYIEMLDAATFLLRRDTLSYDAVGTGKAIASLDPDFVLGDYYISAASMNLGRYNNPQVDKLFEQQLQAITPAERRKLATRVEEVILSDYPRLFAYWVVGSVALWPEVRNYRMPSNQYQNQKYRDLWLAQ